MQWSPFVADSFGCLGARAHSLLDSLATWALMHGRVVVQDGGGRDPRPLLLDRWRSYVSCAVLGGMASRVLFYAARAPPPPAPGCVLGVSLSLSPLVCSVFWGPLVRPRLVWCTTTCTVLVRYLY